MKNQLSRRRLLQATALAPGVISTASAFARREPANNPWVDMHLHCFAGKNDGRFPYHERAPYRPEETATPEHLLKCMETAGVDYAVVVHPEPYQDDHRYLEHCCKLGKGKLKGTLLLFADRVGSLEKMPQLCRQIDVVAVRVHAYAADRLPPFGRPELRKLWKMATEHNLAVQLHFEPRYATGFEPLIREFPKTPVIIDHLGRPFQGTPKEHAVVVRWARFDNTVMKLSSIPSTRSYPHRDIRPVIRQLTDAWGADRLICGGGFSAAAKGESYSQAFERTRSFIDHLSADDQAKVLGKTAVRVFRFGA